MSQGYPNPLESTVRVESTIHAPMARIDSHCPAVDYLSVVLSGSYVERVSSHSVECLPMQLRYHPAREEHSHRMGSRGACCLNIELSSAWRESLDRLDGIRHPLLVQSAGWWALQAAALHRNKSPDAELRFQSIAAELLNLCERESRIQQAVDRSVAIRRAIVSIDDLLAGTISLTSLAAVAGLHPTHFARSFRKNTGLTVGEYVRHRRIGRAQQLMSSNPSMGLSRIAAESGFADHAHLTRTFRQIAGTTPGVYREALERER